MTDPSARPPTDDKLLTGFLPTKEPDHRQGYYQHHGGDNPPLPSTDIAALREAAKKVVRGVGTFADEMKAKGIHLGMGRTPTCVTCGEDWPCSKSKG